MYFCKAVYVWHLINKKEQRKGKQMGYGALQNNINSDTLSPLQTSRLRSSKWGEGPINVLFPGDYGLDISVTYYYCKKIIKEEPPTRDEPP